MLPVSGQSESESTRTFGAWSRSGAGSGLGPPAGLGIPESPASRKISQAAVRDSGVPARASSATISSIPWRSRRSWITRSRAASFFGWLLGPERDSANSPPRSPAR